MAYVKKKLSSQNRKLRTTYGEAHRHKTSNSLWQYINTTDEAHIGSSSQSQGISSVRRERVRIRRIYKNEGDKTGVKLHIPAWVNWCEKAEKVGFYHDEEEYTQRSRCPPKPRNNVRDRRV
ncbi:hypothetical protein BDZ45DRAFT_747534 [Acephala macrosclerotiorum]|nr:hypothetical protein BDZ45DRAFT_747534 [Acephala macrosclerotiorum]